MKRYALSNIGISIVALSIIFIIILIIIVIIFATINREINEPEEKKPVVIKAKKRRKRKQIKVVRENKQRRIDENTINSSKEEVWTEKISSDTCIIDVCNYSKYTVYLMSDYSILLCENGISRDIETNLTIECIASFGGYLFAVSEGNLYYLNNNTLDDTNWEWYGINWCPNNIIDISVPHDKNYIWIRCKDKSYLYDKDGKLVEEIDSTFRRVYGTNKDNYIVFDNNGGALLNPDNQILTGIKDAVFNHKGELFTLSNKEKKYRMIKLVDWKPFFIP